MPWNDNSNTGGKPGPKSGGKPGPWGAPPSGGGGNNNGAGGGPKGPGRPPGKRPPPADLNDIGRQLSRRLGDLFGRGGGGGVKPGAIAVGAGALVAVWALTGVYIVQSDEERHAIRLAAENQAGVKAVEDHLSMMPPASYVF